MRSRLAAVLALALATPGSATAQRIPPRPKKLELGFGVITLMQLNSLDGGDSSTRKINDTEQKVAYADDGFSGLSFGGGLTFLGMYKGFVGGQIDLIFSRDSGTGTYYDEDTTIGSWALHLPVMARGSIPFQFIKPIGFIGPELVIPLSSDAETGKGSGRTVKADAGVYVVPVVGAGVEFKPGDDSSFRIPIVVRFSLNPFVDSNAGERILSLDDAARSTTFDATWQYQAMVTVGLTYNFAVKL